MNGPGRPRKTSIDDAIYEAFAELMIERGFVRVTVEDVVSRAGTSKPAFYRRHRDLADVVPKLLARRHGLDSDIDTGSLAGDLHEVQKRQVQLFSDPVVMHGLIGWAAHVAADPDQAEPFVSSYLAPRRAFTRVLLDRAVVRGEIADGADPAAVADLLTGPLLMRVVLRGLPPVDDALAAHTVAAVLAVLGADPATP